LSAVWRAAQRPQLLPYDNIETRHGNGYNGWPEEAPFDGILVTAAAPDVPPPLVEQLRKGARLVIPIGVPYGHQELMLVEKRPDGSSQTSRVFGVAFVPLTRAP
jgi:protein-L-isoaspartate(D-aspartate) O-methyltransferase